MKDEFWEELGLKKAELSELTSVSAPSFVLDDNEAPDWIKRPDQWREEPVRRIINAIVMRAIRDGASEIAIDPQPSLVRVLLLVDGVRREHLRLPTLTLEPIVAKLKIMGELDVAESAAQYGTIHVQFDGRDYDWKISTHPTDAGEKVVLSMIENV